MVSTEAVANVATAWLTGQPVGVRLHPQQGLQVIPPQQQIYQQNYYQQPRQIQPVLIDANTGQVLRQYPAQTQPNYVIVDEKTYKQIKKRERYDDDDNDDDDKRRRSALF